MACAGSLKDHIVVAAPVDRLCAALRGQHPGVVPGDGGVQQEGVGVGAGHQSGALPF